MFGMLEAVTLVLFPSLMAFAASTDLLTMTISNRVSLGLVAGFVLVAGTAGLPLDLVALHLSCGLAMLALTFSLFSFGWIGGGDAKLAAATAVWLGWTNVLDYGLIASVLGGGLTLGILYLRKMPMPAWAMARAWIARLHDQRNGVPYGIALAVAGLLVYPQTQIWRAVAFG
jgi:prepilin peptidase CpaA